MSQNFQKVVTLLPERKTKMDFWHKLGDVYINDEILKRLLKKYK
jgi:hypothetical protein